MVILGKSFIISKKELEDLYITEKMTMVNISKIFGCCPETVRKNLVKYNIPLRTSSEVTAEYNKNTKRKTNRYDLSGEYGVGYASNTNHEFYFDLEDYDKIKDYCWSENDEGYIITRIHGSNKTIRMHNLVTGFKYVDHIKHNPADNRKSELREANDRFNSQNRSRPVNNTSGCKGVSWNKKSQKWRAYITINGKWTFLGSYNDINDAIKARKRAEEKYFGEWSYDYSMNMDIGGNIWEVEVGVQ